MNTYWTFNLNHVQHISLSNGQSLDVDPDLIKTMKPKQVFEYIRRGAVTGSKVSVSALNLQNKLGHRCFQAKGMVEKEIKAHASKTGCWNGVAADVLFWTGYLSSLDIDYVTPPFEIEYRPELDATPEPARTGKRGRPATGIKGLVVVDIVPSLMQYLTDYGDRHSRFLSLVFESYQRRGARFGAELLAGELVKKKLSLTAAQRKLLDDISAHYGTTLSQSLMMVYSGSEYFVRD